MTPGGVMKDNTLHGVKLKEKEELFAQDVARGLSASDAYRNHYDTSKMQAQSIHTAASQLKTKVTIRIDELVAAAADVAIVDTSMVLRGLLSEAKNIDEGASHSARVAAWAHLGKHLGMFTDKLEHSGSVHQEVSNLTPEQVIERMKQKQDEY